MKGSYYDKFVSESIDTIKNKISQRTFENTVDNGCYTDLSLSRKRLGFVLQNNVEEMDKNLANFDNKWQPSNGKKYWFTNYEDLLRQLRTLIWEKDVKTYYIDNQNSYLWTEIGLLSFLKKEKTKERVDFSNIQFFEANKIFSDSGSFLIFGNQNTINKLNNNAINVFVAGIEQVMKNTDDIELYLKISKDRYKEKNDKLYPIIYTPSSKNNDILFILDNMRSNVMNFIPQRSALACLHCGLCSDVCPVFCNAGDKAYDNIFSGPIASVLLPHLENITDYTFVSYACTLCGNCEKVCPISLPLRDMITENRHYIMEKGLLPFSEKNKNRKMRKALLSRKKLNKISFFKRIKFKKLLSKSLRKNRKIPKMEKYSFNQQYIKNLKEKFNQI